MRYSVPSTSISNFTLDSTSIHSRRLSVYTNVLVFSRGGFSRISTTGFRLHASIIWCRCTKIYHLVRTFNSSCTFLARGISYQPLELGAIASSYLHSQGPVVGYINV